MKRIIGILLLCILVVGCETSARYEMEAQQATLMNESHREIGMPAITNFQEKKLAKMIIEQRDREDLVCYAYIVSNMTGDLIFLGKCIGYGLPYSTQYTCPEVYEYNGATVPQADPNGLFMPDGMSATWLMMLDPSTGDARPVYLEPEIIVSPFPLH